MPNTKRHLKKSNLNAQSPDREVYVQGIPSVNEGLSQVIYVKEEIDRPEIDGGKFAAQTSARLHLQAGDEPTPKTKKVRDQFPKAEITEVTQKANLLVNSYTSCYKKAQNAVHQNKKKAVEPSAVVVEATSSFADVTSTSIVANAASEKLQHKKRNVQKHETNPMEKSTKQECVGNVQSCSNSTSNKKKAHFKYQSSNPNTPNFTDSAFLNVNVATATACNKNPVKNVPGYAKGEKFCDENGSNVQQGLNKRLILCVVLGIIALIGFVIGLYYAVLSNEADYRSIVSSTVSSGANFTPVPDGRVVNVSSSNYVGINAKTCGKVQVRQKRLSKSLDYRHQFGRLIGGHLTEIEKHPWQASLLINNQHTCGGSIIASNWILLAAHCVTPYPKARQWTILVGHADQHYLPYKGQKANARLLIPHQDFDEDTYDNDIALLRLDRHLELNNQVNTLCLSTPSTVPGTQCKISGWGAKKEGGDASQFLEAADVDIIDRTICNQDNWLMGLVLDSMLCAGTEDGSRDACQGDSGGPLACYDHKRQQAVLIGITSWGVGCGEPKFPGVYTNVKQYYSWITKKISQYEMQLR